MLIHFHGRLILAFVAIVVCARPTYGQSPAITGVVVDERTNRPLSGVLVYAANTPAFSETDDEGRIPARRPRRQIHPRRVPRRLLDGRTRD